MVEDPSTVPEPRLATRGRSAGELAREAASLALILAVTLCISRLEHHGLIPIQGYPSSLLLVSLCWIHWRYFCPGERLLTPTRPLRPVLALLPGLVLLLLLLGMASSEPSQSSYVWTWPTLLYLVVIVPFSEELYFRGLLLHHLRRGFPPTGAVMLCTLLFGLLHWPAGSVLVASLLSLVTCVLVLRGGALIYAIQVHVAWNAATQIHRIGDEGQRWRWAGVATAVIVVLTAGLFWKKAAHGSSG